MQIFSSYIAQRADLVLCLAVIASVGCTENSPASAAADPDLSVAALTESHARRGGAAGDESGRGRRGRGQGHAGGGSGGCNDSRGGAGGTGAMGMAGAGRGGGAGAAGAAAGSGGGAAGQPAQCDTSDAHVLVTLGQSIGEFTLAGEELRQLAVPPDGASGDVDDDLRGIAGDLCGQIFAYQGTFVPVIASHGPSGDWTYSTMPGFSTVNDVSYGGLAVSANYVFATDMFTYNGGEAAGVVRFPIAGGPGERFQEGSESIDLTVGLDGVLYVLNGENYVTKFDPTTLLALGNVTLQNAVRSIAVTADGLIYGASWDGSIYAFHNDGTMFEQLATGLGSLADIALGASGRIAASTREGEVVITRLALDSWTSFDPLPLNQFGPNVFVAFPQD